MSTAGGTLVKAGTAAALAATEGSFSFFGGTFVFIRRTVCSTMRMGRCVCYIYMVRDILLSDSAARSNVKNRPTKSAPF